MISSDEYLERIVAGIQAVTTDGAEVNWNEKINGRQFDVVVRFTLGTLSYLVAVEVKNKKRKASASEVEAFVLKAQDHNVNKAVFVTVAGYQGGAVKVAEKHGVDLFTVAFDHSRPRLPKESSYVLWTRRPPRPGESPQMSIGQPELMSRFVDITLVYDDGSEHEVPDEQSQTTYYIRKSKLADGRSLHQVLQTVDIPDVDEGQKEEFETTFDPPQPLTPPDEFAFPSGVLKSIRANVVGMMARIIEGNVAIEPNTFVAPVIYINSLTGKSLEFDVTSLPVGVKRVEVGRFYFILHPLNYFYCESIKGKTVSWKLIESFQSGDLVRADMTQDIKYSPHYIEVTDKETLARMQARLKDYIELQAREASKRPPRR